MKLVILGDDDNVVATRTFSIVEHQDAARMQCAARVLAWLLVTWIETALAQQMSAQGAVSHD